MNAFSSVLGPSRPPRIALFSGNYNYTLDGANKSLNRLVAHLQARTGARVRVYSPTSPEPAFEPQGELISAPSVRIPLRPDYRMALGMPRRIRKDLIEFQPDLIHVSAPDLLGIAAQKFARLEGIPVVTSVHTHFDTYLAYYKMDWLTEIVRRRLHAFYGDSDFILAPTQAIAEEMQAEHQDVPVRIWARGVDSELFHPHWRSQAWRAAQGFDDASPVVVFMGRIVMEKGLGVFAEAIQRLAAEGTPVQVLVIGDGPARAWFEERLPGAVFTGLLTGQALATALASGDIFLNPSVTETFGNANLEAMASGLPLVCADAPNTRFLLKDGGGTLCQPSDAKCYAQAIAELARDPEGRAQMGRLARAAALQHRWPEILDAVVAVYGEALGTRPLARPPGLDMRPADLAMTG